MEQSDNTMPILYMSTYDVVDSKLNTMFIRDMKFEIPLTLQTTIMHRAPSGCTMVFNKKLRDLISKSSPRNLRMHDFWTLMVAEAFHAIIVTDNRSQLKYRQHENNSVGYGTPLRIKIQRWVNSALHGDNERQKQAICFYEEYYETLPDDSKKILEKVVNYRKSFRNKLDLIYDKEFRTYSIVTNIQFIVSVFLGIF